MKNAIDSSAKVDMRETITAFLTQLQVLVLSRVLSNTVILVSCQAVYIVRDNFGFIEPCPVFAFTP